MYYGRVTYEKMLHMTFWCEVNCYVDKMKLQFQTTINASTHMYCSYHELLQRRGTEKENEHSGLLDRFFCSITLMVGNDTC